MYITLQLAADLTACPQKVVSEKMQHKIFCGYHLYRLYPVHSLFRESREQIAFFKEQTSRMHVSGTGHGTSEKCGGLLLYLVVAELENCFLRTCGVNTSELVSCTCI